MKVDAGDLGTFLFFMSSESLQALPDDATLDTGIQDCAPCGMIPARCQARGDIQMLAARRRLPASVKRPTAPTSSYRPQALSSVKVVDPLPFWRWLLVFGHRPPRVYLCEVAWWAAVFPSGGHVSCCLLPRARQ